MNNSLQFIAHNNEQTFVPLSELLGLDEIGVAIPSEVVRPISDDNVVSLMSVNPSTWSEVMVADTSLGPVVLDGRHRWQARKHATILTLLATTEKLDVEDMTYPEQKKLVAKFEMSNPELVAKALQNATIKATLGNYHNLTEALLATLLTNNEHGLASKSRSKKALEYWLIVRTLENPPMQKDVATLFHINKATLNEYISKHDKEQKELQASEEGSEEEVGEQVPENEALKVVKELEKKLPKLMEALDTLQGLDAVKWEEIVNTFLVPGVLKSGFLVPPTPPQEAPKKVSKGKGSKGKGKELPYDSFESEAPITDEDVQSAINVQ